MDDLESRIEELKSMPLSDVTLGEVRDKLRELDKLEQQAWMLKRHGVTQPRGMSSKQWTDKTTTDFRPKSREKERVSEQTVGRYVMTVVAAILCLLAFGALVVTMWPAMPDAGKFALFMIVGIGLEAVGTWRAQKSSMRPFWLGIAGVGAGVSFIDLTAGSFFWGLYGVMMTGVFVFVWFSANLYLGRRQAAGIFYVIAYAGGLMSVLMACEIMGGDSFGAMAVMLLTGAIAMSGLLEFHVEKKQYLLLFHMAFCAAVCYRLSNMTGGDDVAVTLTWFCVAIATLCLFLVRCIKVDLGEWEVLIRAGLTFLFSVLLYNGITSAMGGQIDDAMFARIGLLLLLVCVPGIKSGRGYALGVSFLVFDQLSVVSNYFDCNTLLPAIVIALLAWNGCLTKYWDGRCAMIVGYIYAMTDGHVASDATGKELALVIMTWLVLLTFLWGYVAQARMQNVWPKREYNLLVMFLLPGVTTFLLADADLAPDSLPFLLMSAGLYAYYFMFLRHMSKISAEGAKTLWYIARAVVYVGLMVNMLFASTADKIVLTLAMMLALGFNLYQTVHSRTGIQAVAACLLANWEMMCLTGIWDLEINILISLAGILIAAGFVVTGFVLNIKGSRTVGLACAVLYSIKLGIFDVAGESGFGVAGGLLVAGLLCFGISLAYYKLGQKYETKTSDQDDL